MFGHAHAQPTVASTLVLGVGNVLLSDEGAGVHAMRFLERHHDLPDTVFLDAGTLSFTLAADIAAADYLIVFDAARIEAEPGGIGLFLDDEVDAFLNSGRCSVHEVGFADLLDIARLEGCMPEHYALIGIRPEVLEWGDVPSESVRRALPRAADMAATLIRQWREPSASRAMSQ